MPHLCVDEKSQAAGAVWNLAVCISLMCPSASHVHLPLAVVKPCKLCSATHPVPKKQQTGKFKPGWWCEYKHKSIGFRWSYRIMSYSAGIMKQLHHRKTFICARGGWRAKCMWRDVGLEPRRLQGGFLLWAWISVMLENVTCLPRKASRPLCLLRGKGEHRALLFRQNLTWRNELVYLVIIRQVCLVLSVCFIWYIFHLLSFPFLSREVFCRRELISKM